MLWTQGMQFLTFFSESTLFLYILFRKLLLLLPTLFLDTVSLSWTVFLSNLLNPPFFVPSFLNLSSLSDVTSSARSIFVFAAVVVVMSHRFMHFAKPFHVVLLHTIRSVCTTLLLSVQFFISFLYLRNITILCFSHSFTFFLYIFSDVDEVQKQAIKQVLHNYDRHLLVSDPRRAEAKTVGGRGARSMHAKSYG